MIIRLYPARWIERLVGEEKAYPYNLLLSSITTIMLLICYYLVMGGVSNGGDNPISACIIKRVFTVPCIGCGVSRSVFAIFDLNIMLSMQYNPIGVVFLAFILMQIPLQGLVVASKIQQARASAINNRISIFIIVGLVLIWVYRIVTMLL